jgi:hypothetical protein
MTLTFNDWRPLESFDSLADFKPGAEVFIYDPALEPPVFRAFFRTLVRDRARDRIDGITYEIAPGETVELRVKPKVGLGRLPTYAPRNRVGRSRVLDLEHMHAVSDYDA